MSELGWGETLDLSWFYQAKMMGLVTMTGRGRPRFSETSREVT